MQLEYPIIDCDSHYYEVDDCFTRHIEQRYRHRTVWVDRSRPDGLGIMQLGDERLNFFSVGVGDHVGAPGALTAFFKGETDSDGAVNANPISARERPEFTTREPRLQLMDEQGVEASIMIPTLGVGVEYQLRQPRHREVLYPSLRAFNRWLAEDWGWGADQRIFSTAMISLVDVDEAVQELDRVLAEGCRLVYINTGPVEGRSPADEYFDPFWARMQEAGAIGVYHIGNTPFNELYAAPWGEPANPRSHRFTAMNSFLGMGERTVVDQIAATIFHNLFGRFPGLRFMVVEFGASWVPHLLTTLDKTWRFGDHKTRWRHGRPEQPSEVFRRHFKVVPFHEDPIAAIAEAAGLETVVNGSDFPHPEGLLWPAEMVDNLSAFDSTAQRRIMRGNAAEWLGLAP